MKGKALGYREHGDRLCPRDIKYFLEHGVTLFLKMGFGRSARTLHVIMNLVPLVLQTYVLEASI